jgi:hypothetical protein
MTVALTVIRNPMLSAVVMQWFGVAMFGIFALGVVIALGSMLPRAAVRRCLAAAAIAVLIAGIYAAVAEAVIIIDTRHYCEVYWWDFWTC